MILDTNAVSALFEGDPALARQLELEVKHHLPVITVGEYLFGLQRSQQRATLAPLLETLQAQSVILYPDLQTANQYAAIRGELRAAGTPIPENDIWIAALARQHDLAVVSRDQHFDRVRDLRRLGW